MKAIIETGGKQYFVQEGSILYVEKLDVEAGATIDLDRVLMCNGISGKPYLDNVEVKALVEKHGKNKKIIVFKYKPKKKYRRKQGHRQPYTKLVIKSIMVK